MKNSMQLKALALGSVISLSCLEDYSCYALNSPYSNFLLLPFLFVRHVRMDYSIRRVLFLII